MQFKTNNNCSSEMCILLHTERDRDRERERDRERDRDRQREKIILYYTRIKI